MKASTSVREDMLFIRTRLLPHYDESGSGEYLKGQYKERIQKRKISKDELTAPPFDGEYRNCISVSFYPRHFNLLGFNFMCD